MSSKNEKKYVDAIVIDTVNGPTRERGLAFWLIILGINLSSFLALLEVTVISNALPTIASDIHGVNYVWVAAAYNLVAAAFMPSAGALSQVFGRKAVLTGSLAIFSLGSGICGGAQNAAMLIGGRAIQGAGGAGIITSSAIITSDIVPLSERGIFNGILQLTWCIACGIGPIVGGTLAQRGQWRWLFYMNLPIAPISGIMVLTSLHLKIPRKTLRQNLEQLDLIGNVLIISAACIFTIGIVWGGITFPWSSPQVLVPICLGAVLLVIFIIYEASWSPQPMVPVKLMMNRTTFSGYFQVIVFPIPFIAFVYYLPIYFQACKSASPIRSGVLLFGLAFSTPPFAIISGVLITLTKRYRVQLWAGWTIVIVGFGLLGTTRADTSLAKVIGYETLTGAGFGIIFAATYFPILAPLPVTSFAQALAFYAFLRQFSQILGITLGGTILQNELQRHLPADLLSQISEKAVAIDIIPLFSSLPQSQLAIVRAAFAKSFSTLWYVMVGVSGLGLMVSLIMEHHELNTKVDEDWGIADTRTAAPGVPNQIGQDA